MLCFLAGFSLVTENDLAGRAAGSQRATRLGQLYGDARFWVGQEESLERKYRLEPSPAVQQLHTAAENNLTRDLGLIGRIDRSAAATQRLVAHLVGEQRLYARASQAMFVAVDHHNTPLVIHYDHQIVDPIFGAIEAAVYARSAVSAREALHQADLLRSRTLSARTAITIAFGVGLVLLGAFSLILLGLRRRVRASHRAEIERLANAALTDSLTGLRNHRAFQEDLAGDLRHPETGRPVTLIMLDLNGLKAVNDTRGHQVGDERLQVVADVLSETFRGRDRAYRVGGDEFAVILPGVRAWDALEATQHLQIALSLRAIAVAAGIAEASGPRAPDGLVREADLALIAGKRRGQDVTLYSPELQPAIEPHDVERDAEHVSSLSTALALAVDAKDSYTRSHSQTVSQLCVLIATELALDPALIGQMRLAGLLHDVGKIGIPDAILTKPARLTDAEYEQMKRHSVLGEEIAAAAGLATEARWIRHHHERYDGCGYPDGLAGNDIPLQSRIILTADAFEAMTSDRPYRDAPGRAFAVAELERHAGTQFDPRIVHAFCRALASTPDPDRDTGTRHDPDSDRIQVIPA